MPVLRVENVEGGIVGGIKVGFSLYGEKVFNPFLHFLVVEVAGQQRFTRLLASLSHEGEQELVQKPLDVRFVDVAGLSFSILSEHVVQLPQQLHILEIHN